MAFYLFPQEILKINYGTYGEQLLWFVELAKSCNWIWFYDGVCIVSDRPKHIKKKGIVLHNETGSAVEFRDGYGLWALNGVMMKREYVETPTEKLDVNLVVKETNAEVRRELVRKIGIDRVCMKLGAKVVDTSNDYSLLLLDLGDGRKRPYLKMRNPSIPVWHLEGVHPDCDTVEKALNWRNQTTGKPQVLT